MDDPFPYTYDILYSTGSADHLSGTWTPKVHYKHISTCPLSLFLWDNEVYLTVVNHSGGNIGYHHLTSGKHKVFDNRRTYHGVSMISAPLYASETTSTTTLFMFYTYHVNNGLRMTYARESPMSKNPDWKNDLGLPNEMTTKYPPSTVIYNGKLFCFVNSSNGKGIYHISTPVPVALDPEFTELGLIATASCKSTPTAVVFPPSENAAPYLYVLWIDNEDKINYTYSTDGSNWVSIVQLDDISKTPLSATVWTNNNHTRLIAAYGKKEDGSKNIYYGENSYVV